MKTANPSFVGKPEPVAVVRGVTQTFDDYLTRALVEVSFEVYRGEIFGLIGPPGSGKSTTLKIVAGRQRPTEGKVKVFGRSPWRRATKARIGYLPEHTGRRRESRYARWLSFFTRLFAGFARLETERRASLTQAVLGNRDLIVLDEPFAGLAPADCRETKDLILTLAHRGKTVIFSSGSLTDAKDICHRMAIFYGGKIQAIGTLSELLATPDAIRFTAPVLPTTTAERLLKTIWEELRGETADSETAAENRQSALPDSTQKVSQTGPCPTTTAAEAILAPLTKSAAPAPPLDHPEAVADSVNHEKLEALTKPATEASPTQPGNTSGASADGTNTNEK